MSVLGKNRLARNGYIFVSVMFYIAGILYMRMPEASPMVFCISGGIILIVYGIIKIIGYLSDDLYCLAFQYDLGCGLFLVAVGTILIGRNLHIQQYLSPGLGFLILLDSLMKVQTAKEAKAFGLRSWYLLLDLSIVAGIFGILIVIKPFSGISVQHAVTGCGLLIEGAMNHLLVIQTVKIGKRHSLPDKD